MQRSHSIPAFASLLIVFAAQFLGRMADDNTLFSWSWAFTNAEAHLIYLVLAGLLVLCGFLSRSAVPDRWRMPLLAMLSFGAVVPFWSEPELILDASRYFTQAKYLELYGISFFLREWGSTIAAWTDLPLVPFLYGLVFKGFGEYRVFIQLFTTLLFSLTTVLTYLIGTRLWDRESGFSGALLLLGIPYLLTQVPLMLVDVPSMFFLALSSFTFIAAVERGGGARISVSAVSIACAALSKYSVWFMLSILPVILAVYVSRASGPGRRPVLLRGIAALAAAGAITGSMLLLFSNTVSGQVALLADYQKPGLFRWSESFVSTFLFQVHPFITLFALFSAARALLKRDSGHLITGWLLLLVVVFGIRRIRYILPVFPMLTLMAGHGIQSIRHAGFGRFLVYGVVASSLVVGVLAYLPFAKNMTAANLKHAGEYLDTIEGRDVEVVIAASESPVANPAVAVPLLDLFSGKRIRFDYRAQGFPPAADVKSSPLRFTWEYRNPQFYERGPAEAPSSRLVVLTDIQTGMPRTLKEKLSGYRLDREFTANEHVFQFKLKASVYQKR